MSGVMKLSKLDLEKMTGRIYEHLFTEDMTQHLLTEHSPFLPMKLDLVEERELTPGFVSPELVEDIESIKGINDEILVKLETMKGKVIEWWVTLRMTDWMTSVCPPEYSKVVVMVRKLIEAVDRSINSVHSENRQLLDAYEVTDVHLGHTQSTLQTVLEFLLELVSKQEKCGLPSLGISEWYYKGLDKGTEKQALYTNATQAMKTVSLGTSVRQYIFETQQLKAGADYDRNHRNVGLFLIQSAYADMRKQHKLLKDSLAVRVESVQESLGKIKQLKKSSFHEAYNARQKEIYEYELALIGFLTTLFELGSLWALKLVDRPERYANTGEPDCNEFGFNSALKLKCTKWIQGFQELKEYFSELNLKLYSGHRPIEVGFIQKLIPGDTQVLKKELGVLNSLALSDHDTPVCTPKTTQFGGF